MTDKQGRPYTITDSKMLYRSKQMIGEVVFSPKEIASCATAVDLSGDMGEKMADMLMEAKHVFPGSFVSDAGPDQPKRRKGKFEKW